MVLSGFDAHRSGGIWFGGCGLGLEGGSLREAAPLVVLVSWIVVELVEGFLGYDLDGEVD